MEIVYKGTMRIDGKPRMPGVELNGRHISFGDTVEGYAFPFVYWRNLLVGACCACVSCRRQEIDMVGFIAGKLILIDNELFLCRSLKVGEKEGDPNEWDDILDDLGEDDSIWHWDEQGFFGQEQKMDSEGCLLPVVRGKVFARAYLDERQVQLFAVLGGLGFRPVLEPYGTSCPISEALVGQKINLLIGDGVISGTLKDFSDYDLTLNVSSDSNPDVDSAWMIVCDNGDVIIDRSQIRQSCLVKEGLG